MHTCCSAPATSHFDNWMVSEHRRVYSICQRILQDRDDADSASQDVFLRAFETLKKADAKPLEDPARWLTRVAVNICIDRLRSRKWRFWRRRSHLEDTILHMAASPDPGADDRYFACQIQTRLDAALMALSHRQRTVFLLRHYEGMSLDEIGETLGLEVGTVKTHMRRAVTKLRTELRDFYGITK